ncbi:MAG: quinone-dependent dihydroorotate dehydrogenase [Neomegalonema sp.]|nr:quinone-dependent dihydroorotate dehydrogenase [Neomegalonema sp.]
MALKALQSGLLPASPAPAPRLRTSVWGLDFPSPIGIAAGFDKNAQVPDALLRLPVGFVEIGAVTPRPQSGNPKPRLFRLEEDRAVINRMGFNNDGLAIVAERLRARKAPSGIVGANLGANKDAADRMADFETVLSGLWGLCSFYTINVSSPNTEKLRDLQGSSALRSLLSRVIARRDQLAADSAITAAPILVKIAPDLSEDEIADIAQIALDCRLDGIVATNTTLARPSDLRSASATEKGGLSGLPLQERSTEVIRQLSKHTKGKIPLIGVGGVDSGQSAYDKIRAGASLVQLYTALIYEGPGLIARIHHELDQLLERDGFASIEDAVGAGFTSDGD